MSFTRVCLWLHKNKLFIRHLISKLFCKDILMNACSFKLLISVAIPLFWFFHILVSFKMLHISNTNLEHPSFWPLQNNHDCFIFENFHLQAHWLPCFRLPLMTIYHVSYKLYACYWDLKSNLIYSEYYRNMPILKGFCTPIELLVKPPT